MSIFKKDLIAKYGTCESHYGVSDVELRKALLVRNITFGGVGLILVAALVWGLVYAFEMTLIVVFGLLGFGVLLGLIAIGCWLVDNLPDHLRTIRRAKNEGVWEFDK